MYIVRPANIQFKIIYFSVFSFSTCVVLCIVFICIVVFVFDFFLTYELEITTRVCKRVSMEMAMLCCASPSFA